MSNLCSGAIGAPEELPHLAPTRRCAHEAQRPSRLAPLLLAAAAIAAAAALTGCGQPRLSAIAFTDAEVVLPTDDAGTPEDDAGVVDAGCPTTPCGDECCTADQTCIDGHCLDCQLETDEEFCANRNRVCGPADGIDSCGLQREVASCGTCDAGYKCDPGPGQCIVDCPPEDPQQFCTRMDAACGFVTAADTCGTLRTIDCGSCGAREGCDDATHQCVNICESDSAFCTRLGKQCGLAMGLDNCGDTRVVNECGPCQPTEICDSSQHCQLCPVETDVNFCVRHGKNCGSISGIDNCGNSRTVANCGTCTAPGEACGLNQICAPAGHQSNESCLNPEMLFFDPSGHAHTQGSTYAGVNDDVGYNCSAYGPDLVYTFSIPTAQNVDVLLTPSFPTGSVPVISVRSDCALRYSELGCARLDGATPGALYLRNLAAGDYVVFVDGAGSADFGPFQLDLQLSPTQAAPANDTCASAEALVFDANGVATATPNTLDATDDYQGSCTTTSGPDVIYSFTLAADASVSVKLTRASAARAYVPAVYLRRTVCTSSAVAEELNCGASAKGVAYASQGMLYAGTYYIVVDGLGVTAGPSTLEVVLGPPLANDYCVSPQGAEALPAFDANGVATATGDTSLAHNDDTNGCGGGAGKDLVYSFTLQTDKDVAVEVTPETGIPFRPSASIRSTCDDPTSELACALAASDGAPVRAVGPHLLVGTYYVWVDGPADSQGRFTLKVTATDPPPPPANDVCAGAVPLVYDAATASFSATGTTLNATDDTSGSCATATAPFSGNDLYYSFTLTAPRVVSARITRDAADASFRPAVSIRSDCASYAVPSEIGCAYAATLATASAQTALAYVPAGTYYAVVDGIGGSRGGFTVEVTALSPPANDTCASPEALTLVSGVAATTTGDTTYAFNDTFNNGCGPFQYGNDLVYSFTLARASALEVVVTPTSGSTLAPDVHLRTTCLDNTTLVPGSCKGNAVPNAPVQLDLRLLAGTYYLWVDSMMSNNYGPFSMSVTATDLVLPPNDTCGGAVALTFDPVTNIATATGDTQQAFDDYRGTCQASGNRGGDMVYAFEMVPRAASLTATVTPGNGTYQPAIYLRRACTSGAASDEKACVTASYPGGAATLAIPLLAAGTYYLVVDGANDGPFTLEVTQGAPIMNDNCVAPNSAQELLFDASGYASAAGDTSIGNDDGHGSCYTNSLGGKDVVYTFTLAAEAAIQAVAMPSVGSTVAPNLYLRSACADASSELACRTTMTSGGALTLTYSRLPAGTYYLWVDSFGATSGGFILSVQTSTPMPVANDQCSGAIPITLDAAGRATVYGTTLGAADDSRGTCQTSTALMNGGDVVYSLTLTADAKVTATVARSGGELQPAVYIRGVCASGAAADEYACSAGAGGVSATATVTWLLPGTYFIIVDGVSGGQDGAFLLRVTTGTPLKNDTCRGAEALVFDATGTATFSGDTTSATAQDSHASCNYNGGDLVYSFTLSTVQTVDISASPTSLSGGQIAPALSVRSVCNSPALDFADELGCAYVYNPGTAAALHFPALRAGTYYLWVAAMTTTATYVGPFTGTVTLSTAPPLPANDTCATAELLTPDPVTGHATVSATTVGAINDSAGNCVDLGANELYNGGDVVYSVTLTAPSAMVARVHSDPAPVPLKAAVYIRSVCTSAAASDEKGCGTHLRVNRFTDVWATASAPRLSAGTYYVIVDGMAGTSGPFTLDVWVGPQPDNDTCAAATPLHFDRSTGIAQVSGDLSIATGSGNASCTTAIWGGLDLVYSFTLTQASAVAIDLATTTPVLYQPAVYLRSVCDQPTTEFGCSLAPAQTSAVDLNLPLLGAGTYYVWVKGSYYNTYRTGGGPFTLTITASTPTVTPPANDTCAGATQLAFDAITHTATVSNENTASAAHDFGATCDPAIGPDLVYTFTTTQAQKFVATVTRDVTTPGFVPVVYLRNSCGPTDAAGEVTCAKGAAAAMVTANNLPAGTWYLFVGGGQATTGKYNLEATLSSPVTTGPANESCFSPTNLVLSFSNHATALGTTVGAQNEATGSCAYASGLDVVYSVTTTQLGRLSATVTPSPLSASYYPAVYLRQQCGSSFASDEAACGKTLSAGAAATATVTNAAAGTWFIWVDSASNATPGDFTLDVALVPTNPPPSNDTCSAPTALSPAVSVSGTTATATANYTGLLNLMECGGSAVGGPDVVYTYTPAVSGPFTVTLTPSGWSATLWMSSASCGGVRDCIGVTGSVGPGSPASLAWPTGTAGTTYYLVVTGFSATDSGAFDIQVQ